MSVRIATKRGTAGLALVLSLGLLAGCSAISEIQKIQEAIPDVKVDEEGGSVTIKGDDGEEMTIETDVSGELPDWFPSELPLPADYAIENVSSMEYGEESIKSVTISTGEDFTALIAVIDDGLAAAGLTPNGRMVNEGTSTQSALVGVPVDGVDWQINVLDYGEESDEGVWVTYGSMVEID